MAKAILQHEPPGSCASPFAAEGGIKIISFFLILAHPSFSGKKKRSTKKDRTGCLSGGFMGLPRGFG